MISLRNLQREMVNFALGESATAPSEWIVVNGLSAERRLGVYRNNAQMGFSNALQATFPVLVRLSGEDWFNHTALCYQRLHMSRSGDLNTVGSAFAAFLADTLRGGEYEYFADVARLEWAYSQALNQREAAPANFEGLDRATDESYRHLRFVVNPTACLIESKYPLFAIWRSNRGDSKNPQMIHLNQGGSLLLLIRRADHVDIRELAPHAFALLRAFAGGATVHAGVDSVVEVMGEFDLADAFGQLVQLEALIGFEAAVHGGPGVS